MGTKQVVGASLLAVILFATTATFADTISGSGTAAFQSWTARDLNNSGKPYWDNKSLDGKTKQLKKKGNVGFYLTPGSAVTLADTPGVLPYWGTAYNSKKDKGGNADLNFFFQRTELTNTASLRLEVSPDANIDEFGWYDIKNPSVLHPIFDGPESPITNDTFSPSLQYGFYLQRADQATFYTDSSLNPYKDTLHQHFVVFEQLTTTGTAIYWLGIENRTQLELKGKEGRFGDYNDMLVRIGASSPLPVPEPSTVSLALGNTLLMLLVAGLLVRRR